MPWAVAAAAVGVGGSVYAANKASKASAGGANDAARTQQYMYDTTREDLAPYRDVGTSALGKLASFYGLAQPTTGAQRVAQQPFSAEGRINDEKTVQMMFNQVFGRDAEPEAVRYYIGKDIGSVLNEMRNSPEYQQRAQQGWLPDRESGVVKNQPQQGGQPKDQYADFYNSPDYRFALEQGTRAVDQSLAARGLSNSGRAAKELTRFGQGLASQKLGDYLNRLSSLAGVGQTATTTTAQAGQGAANQISGAQQNAADARASGYLGIGNAINSGIEQGYGMWWLNQQGKKT